jgi:hypothetical protein
MPLINATAPDARFIYEALDAAKSLLTTFNNFVEPETLRYMPSSYYLFIIYSAVFLYKARSTTTMTDEERTSVRRMINHTIERLQKASVGANHMGSRYARLLQMLWRKAPKASDPRLNQKPPLQSMDGRIAPMHPNTSSPQQNFDPNQQQFNMAPMNNVSMHSNGGVPGMFSWLDLGATWNFATQNNSASVTSGSAGEIDDVMLENGMSPFDLSLVTDYSLLEGDNPSLIF